MEIYLWLLVALLIGAVAIPHKEGPAFRAAYSVFALVAVSLPAITRGPSVGADTPQYYRYFTIIRELRWTDVAEVRYEPGYFYLNKFFGLLTDNAQVFIAASSALVLASFAWWVWKYSPNVVVTWLLFILLHGYSMVLTALRQSLAMAVLLVAIPQLIARRRLTYIALVLLAAQFHQTALVALLLVVLVEARAGIRSVTAYVLASVAVFIFSRDLLQRLALSYDRYGAYLESYDEGAAKTGVVFVLAAFLALTILVSRFLKGKEGPGAGLPREDSLLYHGSWMLMPVMALAYGSSSYMRLSNYFLPILCVAVPVALGRSGRRQAQQIWVAVILLAGLAFYLTVLTLRPEWYRITPFETPLFSPGPAPA